MGGLFLLGEHREAHHILHSQKSVPLHFSLLHTAPWPVFPSPYCWKTLKLSRPIHIFTQPVSSVAHCVWLCDPMDCSTPGFPVHCQLLEIAQTRFEAVMPSSHFILCCPLVFLLFRLSQHQSLFQ